MSVTPPVVAASIASLVAARTAAGTLQGASDAILAPLVDAALETAALISTTITATDVTIGDGSSLAGGTPANVAVAYLTANIAANETQYNLLTMQALVARIELNIAARF